MFGGLQKVMIVGLPWFRREDWPALRALFVDADTLHAEWEDWQQSATKVEAQIRASGQRVVRAELRPEAFAAYCSTLGIPTDAEARLLWANEAAERDTQTHH